MATESEFSRFHKAFRALWTVCLFGVGLAVGISLAYYIPRYLEYPVTVDVAMVTPAKVPFPAVTLCNTNRFRKSAMEESQYRDLLLLDRPGGLSNLMPYIGPCFHGDVSCDEHAAECVKSYMACDGVDDCGNGADERNCSRTGAPVPDDHTVCGEDAFVCNNSKCISSLLVCDYIDHCGDFSDEENCTYLTDCGNDTFQCSGDTEGTNCIPGYFVCDRIKQCPNGLDEEGCDYPVQTGNATLDLFVGNWTLPYHNVTRTGRYYENFRENVYKPNALASMLTGDPPSLIPLLLASASPTFDDVRAALAITADEMRELGHQAEDFIFECSYGGMTCGAEDFEMFQHDKFGNCFTFNDESAVTKRTARKPGPEHGLKLTLSAELHEYTGISGSQTGFKVLIHDRAEKPFPDKDGFYASPGMLTSASMERMTIARLEEPFGVCSTESTKDCEVMCLRRHLRDYCGCVDALADHNTTMTCDRSNHTQDMCRQMMLHFSAVGILQCHCPPPCSETQYRISTTQTTWPSPVYVPHLLNSLHYSNDKTWTLSDETSVRNNLVSLEVYFRDFTEQKIEEIPEYTLAKLLSEVGLYVATWMSLALLLVVLGYVCCGPKGETGEPQKADGVQSDQEKQANHLANGSLEEVADQDTIETKL